MGKKKRIICIDDDTSQRQSILKFLSKKGYTVEVYERGEDVLEAIDGHDIPLIITDLEMPGMNGIELCGKIREKCSKSVIYALSGHLLSFDYENLENLGFDGHLGKPVDPEYLEIAIKGAFDRMDALKNS